MPQQVPDTRTPVTPAAMWPVMGARSGVKTGSPPTAGQLMIIMAQWMLETGDGQEFIQYNVGNIKHTPTDGLDWCSYMTTEGDPPVKMVQSFKAYPSLEAGIDAYLSVFLTGRYSNAWPFVLDGDPDGFSQALKDRGYYTANEAGYDAAMRARLRELEAMSLPDPEGGP